MESEDKTAGIPRRFTREDWRNWAGVVRFLNGGEPCIVEFPVNIKSVPGATHAVAIVAEDGVTLEFYTDDVMKEGTSYILVHGVKVVGFAQGKADVGDQFLIPEWLAEATLQKIVESINNGVIPPGFVLN